MNKIRIQLIRIRMYITNRCYKCGNSLEGCLVISSEPPYCCCGECGVSFDKNTFGKNSDDI